MTATLARAFDAEDVAEWRRHVDTQVANLVVWLNDTQPPVPTDPRFKTFATDRDFYRSYFTSIAKSIWASQIVAQKAANERVY